MSTCLCDAFYDDVARASVEVLEYLGCTVTFPEAQTCCGQPAFNAGDWKAARQVMRHTLDVFAGDKPVILPSGSCAGMLYHGAELAFEKEADLSVVQALAARTWELADFIVNGLGVKQWIGSFPQKVAFHRSCHTRGSDCPAAALQLLGSIEGIEVLPVGEVEQCCGFGGTFSVAFPHISTKMGQLKLQHLLEPKPDAICSLDMACLMHLGGLLDKEGTPVPRLHLAQILRQALVNAGELAPLPTSR